MSGVLKYGTIAAAILYAIIGIFGYLTFVDNPTVTPYDALKSENILEAPYPNILPIEIGNFALFFAVATASPLCVLPAKDTVEEIISKGNPNRRLTKKENILVTFGLISLCYALGLFIPNIGAAMTIVGSTTNPAVGFILPIVFYWKTLDDLPLCSYEKIFALIVAVVIILTSILGLVNFFIGVATDDD